MQPRTDFAKMDEKSPKLDRSGSILFRVGTTLSMGHFGDQITSARWTADEDARNQLVINAMRAAELPTTGSD